MHGETIVDWGKTRCHSQSKLFAIHCLSLIDGLTMRSLPRGGMFWGFNPGDPNDQEGISAGVGVMHSRRDTLITFLKNMYFQEVIRGPLGVYWRAHPSLLQGMFTKFFSIVQISYLG